MLQELWSYIQQNNLAGAGVITAGAATLGASLWSIARSYPNMLVRYITRRCSFSATIEHTDPLYKYVDDYLSAKYPHKFRRVEIEIKDISKWYTDEEWVGETQVRSSRPAIQPQLKISHDNDFVIFWNRCRRITASKTKEKLEAARSTHDMFRKAYTFSGLFARKSILDLLEQLRVEGVEKDEAERESKKVVSYKNHASHGNWNFSTPIEGKTFDSIFLEQKEEIVADLDDFLSKKDLYSKFRVPFKRGYLFYGAPGNGKSATVLAIANYLKYDIYALNVTALYPENFRDCIEKIPSNSIVLVEDIDGYYNKRKPLEQNKIAFSQFINALSGVEKKENILTIFTTNHIEKLDPALIRDGRCDKHIEFKNPSKNIVEEFLSYVHELPVTISKYKERCFAEIQNIALKNVDNLNKTLKLLQNV
jgi:hypothetical protein